MNVSQFLSNKLLNLFNIHYKYILTETSLYIKSVFKIKVFYKTFFFFLMYGIILVYKFFSLIDLVSQKVKKY